MKTIEERAKEYSLKDFDGYYTGREKAVEEGYIAGATEQKAIDIDKACKWLKENVEGGVHPQSAYGFAYRFRKAMEE